MGSFLLFYDKLRVITNQRFYPRLAREERMEQFNEAFLISFIPEECFDDLCCRDGDTRGGGDTLRSQDK